MALNSENAFSYVHFGSSHVFHSDHMSCHLCNPVRQKWWHWAISIFHKGTSIKNEISSTQYTLLTIFPMSFINQLKRRANIYFIFIGILYMTPLFNQNKFYAVMPLCFVLTVSILKDVKEFMVLCFFGCF